MLLLSDAVRQDFPQKPLVELSFHGVFQSFDLYQLDLNRAYNHGRFSQYRHLVPVVSYPEGHWVWFLEDLTLCHHWLEF